MEQDKKGDNKRLKNNFGQKFCRVCECQIPSTQKGIQEHNQGIKHRRLQLRERHSLDENHNVVSCFENIDEESQPNQKIKSYTTKDPIKFYSRKQSTQDPDRISLVCSQRMNREKKRDSNLGTYRFDDYWSSRNTQGPYNRVQLIFRNLHRYLDFIKYTKTEHQSLIQRVQIDLMNIVGGQYSDSRYFKALELFEQDFFEATVQQIKCMVQSEYQQKFGDIYTVNFSNKEDAMKQAPSQLVALAWYFRQNQISKVLNMYIKFNQDNSYNGGLQWALEYLSQGLPKSNIRDLTLTLQESQGIFYSLEKISVVFVSQIKENTTLQRFILVLPAIFKITIEHHLICSYKEAYYNRKKLINKLRLISLVGLLKVLPREVCKEVLDKVLNFNFEFEIQESSNEDLELPPKTYQGEDLQYLQSFM